MSVNTYNEMLRAHHHITESVHEAAKAAGMDKREFCKANGFEYERLYADPLCDLSMFLVIKVAAACNTTPSELLKGVGDNA